jgi:hypothetical protein
LHLSSENSVSTFAYKFDLYRYTACLERLLESDKSGHANSTMNNGRTPLQLAVGLLYKLNPVESIA